ncbi:MAG: DUF1838 family protein [Woeseiaceae bacterium]|nr:DUF1838 family protein [Woeseiaceae bacterium]
MTMRAAFATIFSIGFLIGGAEARTLDPENPDDAILLSQKMTCSLVEGDDVIYWWYGGAYSRVPGEQDRHLFNVQGMNVRHCANFEDEERGHGYRMVSREILLYLDPETDKVLRTWTNPWTDAEVEVIHVANDPVNMRGPRYAYDADGNGTTFRGRFIEGRVWTSGEAPLFYTNPLAGDYQDYVGGTYHAMEMLNSYTYEEPLLDSTIDELDDVTISWARTSNWLPWMEMGDRVGMMIFTTVGKRVATIDDLSEPLLTELRTNYPEYAEPPPLDDDRPNVTSWIYFKRVLEGRAEEEGGE